jgi:hypothetical protein
MTAALRDQLRQRADYTHKHNIKTGRHGWLRLTPAYSVKVVDELIGGYDEPLRILDPFAGTSTTALSAAYHGHEGITLDINPFLVWFGRTKVAHYGPTHIKATRDACARALKLVRDNAVPPVPVPPLHKIDRWWTPEALTFLRELRAAIDEATEPGSPPRDLLIIAFCRTLIATSNAAFNHQSMSFKDDGQASFPLLDMHAMYGEDVRFVLDGAANNPHGSGEIILTDSRNPAVANAGSFDLVITSPPYANRMSYIRELRPYMYWLGFLVDGRDAGDLDWSAIGGTWGIATSRLTEWERPEQHYKHPLLDDVLDQIAHHSNKSGYILANYVAKYFDDMWEHFRNLPAVLAPQAEAHYIVGNSTFYGTVLHVEQIYAAMMKAVGFQRVECVPIRKRNSKKELIEFDVTAKWRA